MVVQHKSYRFIIILAHTFETWCTIDRAFLLGPNQAGHDRSRTSHSRTKPQNSVRGKLFESIQSTSPVSRRIASIERGGSTRRPMLPRGVAVRVAAACFFSWRIAKSVPHARTVLVYWYKVVYSNTYVVPYPQHAITGSLLPRILSLYLKSTLATQQTATSIATTMKISALATLALIAPAAAEVYFKEQFNDEVRF